MKTQIIDDFKSKYKDKADLNPNIAYYYGTYSGSTAVKIYGEWPVTEVVWTETVCGYSFTYYDGGDFVWIYNDGKFYTLTEAFDSGLLSKDDIRDIYWYYHIPKNDSGDVIIVEPEPEYNIYLKIGESYTKGPLSENRRFGWKCDCEVTPFDGIKVDSYYMSPPWDTSQPGSYDEIYYTFTALKTGFYTVVLTSTGYSGPGYGGSELINVPPKQIVFSITVIEKEPEYNIELKIGESYELVLEGSFMPGYEWNHTVYPSAGIEVGCKYESPPGALDAAIVTYNFTAAKTGFYTTTLIHTYYGEITKQIVFSITVIDDNIVRFKDVDPIDSYFNTGKSFIVNSFDELPKETTNMIPRKNIQFYGYDDEFFKDNSILFILITSANRPVIAVFDSIFNENGTLVINAKRWQGTLFAIGSCYYKIDVKKSDIKNITDFKINYTDVKSFEEFDFSDKYISIRDDRYGGIEFTGDDTLFKNIRPVMSIGENSSFYYVAELKEPGKKNVLDICNEFYINYGEKYIIADPVFIS